MVDFQPICLAFPDDYGWTPILKLFYYVHTVVYWNIHYKVKVENEMDIQRSQKGDYFK